MINQVTKVHQHLSAKACAALQGGMKPDIHYALDEIERLMPLIGVGFNKGVVKQMENMFAMDTIQQNVTTASLAAPLQFLQNFLPGIVGVVTASREIDDLVGMTTAGAWEDEQVIQQILELSGAPAPYHDNNNVPLSDWNTNFVTRTVVRFEQGMRVGNLEEARSARVNINSGEQKRKSAALQLEIQRNSLGFFGYNAGNGLTYGLMNDPNLPAYTNVANPGSGTTWAVKTFLQIQADILTALQTLRTQSQNTIKPDKTPITMVVAMSAVDYLAKTSDFGISVYDWLKQFYPNVTVKSAPQFDAANGGANVFYLYADTVQDDASTDDHKTFIQIVPAKFQMLGVAKLAKGYEEDYSNASAGVMCKRPYAVVRKSGI